MDILSVIIGLGLLCVGFFASHLIQAGKVKKIESERKEKFNEIVERAKEKAKDIQYRARQEMKQTLREEKLKLEDEFKKLKDDLSQHQKSIEKKQSDFERRVKNLDTKEQKLQDMENKIGDERKSIQDAKDKYEEKRKEIINELERVAQISREEARGRLEDEMVEEAKVHASKAINRIEEETKEQAERKAKRVIGIAIQRFAGEYVAERTITSVELPSDDVKGRLIGREGRNIRAFEQICGVDLIIDDTPETVVISSFNVVRREIARQTIKKLLDDGRIHPAKIEEFYEKSKSEFEVRLRELGEKAQMEIGVHGIHPEILKLVGALNYRTSYTQNQYQHALEAAMICGAMAAELGINVRQARRAGLLHDIGKVLDASAESSHAMTGADFARKFGEHPDIVHAIRAHHDDEKPESVLAHIVAASDALSGARPGARKAMQESYISRLTDIEKIANSFEGVGRSYAISAGREVRVLVENDKVDDEATVMLSRDIAKKIEEEMSYPGTIKITVLRETKAVGVAK
ncbi:MAG: ribonuclease Y [Bacteriovoracales bacterium]|nr:ribonuclease Y [Bacteriovoracales bacterium]